MDIRNNTLLAIGNAPVVRLNRLNKGLDANVFVKLEFFNPTGSPR